MKSLDRILVVDDHKLVRELVKDTLTNERHIVDTAEDGLAALKAIEGGGYSLVITDFQMPGRNGIELIRDLRARGDRIPIVLMSGTFIPMDEKVLGDLGGVGFLLKLFGADELKAAIQMVRSTS